jgi:hypothetical protein
MLHYCLFSGQGRLAIGFFAGEDVAIGLAKV